MLGMLDYTVSEPGFLNRSCIPTTNYGIGNAELRNGEPSGATGTKRKLDDGEAAINHAVHAVNRAIS